MPLISSANKNPNSKISNDRRNSTCAAGRFSRARGKATTERKKATPSCLGEMGGGRGSTPFAPTRAGTTMKMARHFIQSIKGSIGFIDGLLSGEGTWTAQHWAGGTASGRSGGDPVGGCGSDRLPRRSRLIRRVGGTGHRLADESGRVAA